jgi:hypothetical protein
VSNDLNPSTLALNSVSCVKNDKCVIVVNGNDAVIQYAAKENILYGPYHNIITKDGVSAFWNGYVSNSAKSSVSLPLVLSQGKAVEVIAPDNMTHPMTLLAFYQEGKAKASLSEEDAIAKLVKLTDEKKLDSIKALLKDVKCFTIGKPQEIASLV